VRLRAAIEAAPYVHPKLSATASVIVGGDFAERLEQAIERTRLGVIDRSCPKGRTMGDNDEHWLVLVALMLAALLAGAWFLMGGKSERSIVRECNTVTLKDRPADCLSSEHQSRSR
jgi:hypothetical protein